MLNKIDGPVQAKTSLFDILCDDRFEQSEAYPHVFHKFDDGEVEMVVVVHGNDILSHAQAMKEWFAVSLEESL